MNFPVFSQLARKSGHRDGFAPDCLLQQRVRCELDLGEGGLPMRLPPYRPILVSVNGPLLEPATTRRMRRERTTTNVRFQPEIIALDREMVS